MPALIFKERDVLVFSCGKQQRQAGVFLFWKIPLNNVEFGLRKESGFSLVPNREW